MSEITRSPRYDFFLAHASTDTASAEALYAVLSREHNVFLDSACLHVGDVWDVEIPRALAAAAVIVFLLSSRTEGSYYVQEEIAAAIALLRGEGGRHRVVPVYLDGDVAPPEVPYGLRRLHAIFASERQFPEEVGGLLTAALAASREHGAQSGSTASSVVVATRASPLEAVLEIHSEATPATLPIWEGDSVDFGRFPKTGIIVDHPAVSRRHAAFTLSRAGLSVRDLGSKNGTYVNGEPVLAASLSTGDAVGLGRHGPRIVIRAAPRLPGSTQTEKQS